MVMKVEGSAFEVVVANFVAECVWEDNSNMMEGIGNIEKISHKDFVLLVPMVEIEIEVEAKVEIEIEMEPRFLPRIPVWWGLKIHLIVKSLILWPLPRSSSNKTKRFCRI